MATLKAIKKRIGATQSTKKLTRAMRMIAAAKLRKAQMRALEGRLFATELERVLIEIIKRSVNLTHPLLKEPAERKNNIDMVVFTSDRGLCGVFNENLLRHAVTFIKEKYEKNVRVQTTVLGRKGRDFLRREGVVINKEFINLNENLFAEIMTSELPVLKQRFLSGEVDEIIIAFNKFKGVGSYEPCLHRLFPASPPIIDEEYSIDYIYEPVKQDVIEWLITQGINSRFKMAYFESIAGELSARMVTMDKATKNAEELINSLTTQYNRARQSAITKDLIDIVGGAEALK